MNNILQSRLPPLTPRNIYNDPLLFCSFIVRTQNICTELPLHISFILFPLPSCHYNSLFPMSLYFSFICKTALPWHKFHLFSGLPTCLSFSRLVSIYYFFIFFILNPLPPGLSPPTPLNLLWVQFIFILYNGISRCVLLSYWSTILVIVDIFLLEITYLDSLCSTPLFCFVFFYFPNNFPLQILHGLFSLKTP